MLGRPAGDTHPAAMSDQEARTQDRKRPKVYAILDRLKQAHGAGYSEKHTRQSNEVHVASSVNPQATATTLPSSSNAITLETTEGEMPCPGDLVTVAKSSLDLPSSASLEAACSNVPLVIVGQSTEAPRKKLATHDTILSVHRNGAFAEEGETDTSPSGQPPCESLPTPSVLPLENRLACLGPKNELVWNPGEESLESFLSVASPSMVWSPCQWIVVTNNNPASTSYAPSPGLSCNVTPIKRILIELEAKVHANQTISAKEKSSVAERVLSIAQAQKFTMGKWIIRFSPTDRLDEFWKRLAEHTANGNLGCCIKIAPAKYLRHETFEKVLCCVYVNDFSDTAEVKRVWWALRELGFCRFGVLGFKPEIYSLCGISSGNTSRLKTVLYSFEEALLWEEDDVLAKE